MVSLHRNGSPPPGPGALLPVTSDIGWTHRRMPVGLQVSNLLAGLRSRGSHQISSPLRLSFINPARSRRSIRIAYSPDGCVDECPRDYKFRSSRCGFESRSCSGSPERGSSNGRAGVSQPLVVVASLSSTHQATRARSSFWPRHPAAALGPAAVGTLRRPVLANACGTTSIFRVWVRIPLAARATGRR